MFFQVSCHFSMIFIKGLPIVTGRNEVLAKVIFSQACVKNSVHGGGSSKFLGGVLQIFGRGVLQFFLGGSSRFFWGGRSPVFWRGGGSPPEYGQRSAGTHPTGMHSCLKLKFALVVKLLFAV